MKKSIKERKATTSSIKEINKRYSKSLLKGLPILESIRNVERRLNRLSYDFSGKPYATSAVAEKILHNLEPAKHHRVVPGLMADEDHSYVRPDYKDYLLGAEKKSEKRVHDPEIGLYLLEDEPRIIDPHYWVQFDGFLLDFTKGIYRPDELVYKDHEQWLAKKKGNLTPLYEEVPDRMLVVNTNRDFVDWAVERYPLVDNPVCYVDQLVHYIKLSRIEEGTHK